MALSEDAAISGSGEVRRRRSRRRPAPRVFIALEDSEFAEEFAWAGNAVDINGDGVAMAMPPEVEEGSEVLLTFTLEGADFGRLPATVVRQHRDFGVGALEFGEWPERERLALLSYLLER